ncbi:MAG: hypothetical protein J07HN6_02861 [Halonotius sp. J07HN6]|jgi:hypothetical protein|nr:MAG: hypothetical protein J07HN6_02861 [Halonotius sp. J07HN6]
MGFGDTAKKIQTLADTAEQMYGRLKALRTEVDATKQTVDETSERVQSLESELDEQRALLEAIGDELDVDTETVIDNADISGGGAATDEEAEAQPANDAASNTDAADDTDTADDSTAPSKTSG